MEHSFYDKRVRQRKKHKGNETKKIMEILATTLLPVNRLPSTDCNAAARANKENIPVGIVAINVVASRLPNGDWLQRRLLFPKWRRP